MYIKQSFQSCTTTRVTAPTLSASFCQPTQHGPENLRKISTDLILLHYRIFKTKLFLSREKRALSTNPNFVKLIDKKDYPHHKNLLQNIDNLRISRSDKLKSMHSIRPHTLFELRSQRDQIYLDFKTLSMCTTRTP